MLTNTFKDSTQYYTDEFSLPSRWTLENYKIILVDFKFMRYFLNSAIIASSSIFLIVTIGIIGGYTFAKIRFNGKEIAYLIIISTMFIPGQAMIIPQYVMFSKTNLINNFFAVVLAELAGGIPGAILLLRGAFMGVPNDLLESARIDGAGFFTTILRVAVPATSAAIVTEIIFVFLGSWNSLIAPLLFLTDNNKQTIMVALSNLVTRVQSNPTRQLTGMFLSVLPTLALYLCLQKFMIKGMLAGAIKA